ncbi:MAG: peptide chain release factor N(5)-glutamine methyltransferase [Patescibacteria group bacterium]
MTINQALVGATKKLKAKNITSADLDAEVLLSHVLKKPREHLLAHPFTNLKTYQLNNFQTFIKRRAQHQPVAYLTGHKEFYGLDFIVNKSVLIPRPETESLVEAVIKEIRNKSLTIADIGTGSGCIAIALKKNLPKTKVLATDKSATALKVAKQNARLHSVRIQFIQGDLLEPVKNQMINIIVANLPYLDNNMKNLLKSSESKALKYEPPMALKGGPDGMNIYRRFFTQIIELSYKPQAVFWEYNGQVKRLDKQ